MLVLSGTMYCIITCKYLQESQNFSSVSEVEKFLLKHGENVVDTLGAEVDRIETRIQVIDKIMNKRMQYLIDLYFAIQLAERSSRD